MPPSEPPLLPPCCFCCCCLPWALAGASAAAAAAAHLWPGALQLLAVRQRAALLLSILDRQLACSVKLRSEPLLRVVEWPTVSVAGSVHQQRSAACGAREPACVDAQSSPLHISMCMGISDHRSSWCYVAGTPMCCANKVKTTWKGMKCICKQLTVPCWAEQPRGQQRGRVLAVFLVADSA